MKLKDIYEELLEIAKNSGITIRKENGRFRSGYCIINDQKLVVLNKNTTLEVSSTIVARCLINGAEIDEIFVKPAIREYIEKERRNLPKEDNYKIVVDY